jgi:hypothetical protein
MVFADSAAAAGTLRFSTNGGSTWTTVTDNLAGDLDPTPGGITANFAPGNVSVGFLSGTTSSPVFDWNANLRGSGTFLIQFSEIGFTGTPIAFTTGYGGTNTIGNTSLTSYLDTGNGLFGTGTTLTTLGPLSGVSFNSSGTSPFYSGSTPYSLTLAATVVHNSFGSSNFAASLQAVPEPLTILGSGIALGFGAALKRRLGQMQKA